MAENTNFHNEKIKFIVAQLNCISNSYLHNHRRIRISSFTNNLKEITMAIKVNLAHDSESAYNLFKLYANLKGLDINNLPAVMEEYVKDLEFYYAEEKKYVRASGNNFLIHVVAGINSTINEIDRHIEVLRSSYGIENSNDARFNKTNPKDVYTATYDDPSMFKDWNHTKQEYEDKDVKWDIDAMKQNCKMLNSFKNDIINSFNKSFGDKSIFAPLNLSEILVK